MTDFLNDDENVKDLRATANRLGVTALLLDARREHVQTQVALDRTRARITRALELLGVTDDGGRS